LKEGEIDGSWGGEGCEIGRVDGEGFVAGFAVYEEERWGWGVGGPGFGSAGVPRMMPSLVHDMVTVRGIDRSKDQILRRTSIGRVGKR
jgi:hypothetical protein